MEFLTQFFALCLDGLWEVSTERFDTINPTVKRIANRPGQDKAKGDVTRLKTGITVGIGVMGIQVFRQPYIGDVIGSRGDEQKLLNLELIEEVGRTNRGASTGKLIALFLDRTVAEEVNKEMVQHVAERDLFSLMDDWSVSTIETLRTIGSNHPVFVICRNGRVGWRFPMNFYDEAGITTWKRPEVKRGLLISTMPRLELETKQEEAFVGKEKKTPTSHAPTADLKAFIKEHFSGELPDMTKYLPPPAPPAPPKPTPVPSCKTVRGPRPKKAEVVTYTMARPSAPPAFSGTLEGVVYLPMEERVFYEFYFPRLLRAVTHFGATEAIGFKVEATKYEVELIKSPLGVENDPWFILKGKSFIVGNSVSGWWQQWEKEQEGSEMRIVRTTLPSNAEC